MIPFASQKKDANEVLSSIRRMVSEEAQNKAAEALEPLELGIADLADRTPLMLTPEQAIDEPKEDAAPSVPLAQPKGQEMTDARPSTETGADDMAVNLLVDDIAEDSAVAFDEQRLRTLVREVIREEFEGDLGERVSRNIRRLVRREIAQAFNGGQSKAEG